MDAPEERCPRCSRVYRDFSQHTRWHPECDPTRARACAVAEQPQSDDRPEDPWCARVHLDLLVDEVARGLMDMRYEHGVQEPEVVLIKRYVGEWVRGISDVCTQRLLASGYLTAAGMEADLQALLTVDLFSEISTKPKEFTAAKRALPYLKPRVVHPDGNGKGEPVVSFDIAALLERKLQNDPAFRRKILAASDEYMKGERYQVVPDGNISDIMRGAKAAFHPHLLRPATADEAYDVRVPLLFNADDIEPQKNALSTAAGKHKQCGFQTAVLSLPAKERFKTDEILLVALCRTSVYKKHGMARVLEGRSQDGVRHDEPNYVADMERLDEGVWMTIPDDKKGGTRRIRLRAWDLAGAFDHLGRQACLPYVESPSAHHFCGRCNIDQSVDRAFRPLSFLRKAATCAPIPGAAKCARVHTPELREGARVLQLLRSLRGSTDSKAVAAAFKEHGVNTLYSALENVPHIDVSDFAPEDALHLFPDGLLRSQGAWLVYRLNQLGLSPAVINAAMARYKDWPPDVRIPPIQMKLCKGTQSGCPKSSATLRMTGSQVMHFALHR